VLGSGDITFWSDDFSANGYVRDCSLWLAHELEYVDESWFAAAAGGRPYERQNHEY